MSANERSTSAPATQGDRPAARRIYSASVVALPVFSMCLLLWVAGTHWFMQHNAYPLLRNIGYGLSLKHEDCEVVLYGDSSALTGYDPGVIQRVTGMKACNVSEGGTITGVVGSYPLDAYLRQNKRPKYLVMMFTPSIFRPSQHWLSDPKPEGYTYLMQFFNAEPVFRTLLSRPKETSRYAAWVGARLVADLWGRLTQSNPDDPVKDGGAERQRRRGIVAFPFPPETHCLRTAFHLSPTSFSGDPRGAAEAREKYAVGGTQVFINVAPVPTCDELQDTYERILAGEHDNVFERLPISWFNSEDVHFDAAGANYLSAEVAQQILEREHQLAQAATN